MSENKYTQFLDDIPPMGIYKTLYSFWDSFGSYMGTKGTHPWSQGYPITSKIEGGPELPKNIEITEDDLMYPKAWGLPSLREVIASYYNDYY